MIAKLSRAFVYFVSVVSVVSLAVTVAGCGDGWTAEEGSPPAAESSGSTLAHFCPEVVMCMHGLHWDSARCSCVSKPAPAPIVCAMQRACGAGATWDAHHCRCARRADALAPRDDTEAIVP